MHHSAANPFLSDEPLRPLETLDGYVAKFMDLAVWEPYVRGVCRRAGLTCQLVRTGLAGTYPTFIVDERWVVKFFGRLFDGNSAFQVEQAAARLVAQDVRIPAPGVVTSGRLFQALGGWDWPYLVFDFVHGASIGEVGAQLDHEARLDMAAAFGKTIRRLHSLSLGDSSVFRASWESYASFLEQQRVTCEDRLRRWGTWPAHLIDQIPGYLLPVSALIDFESTPHLIHADLTRDHLLGEVVAGEWQTNGLIDFGDAMVGNLYYELGALHLDMFDCDRRLLGQFLRSYFDGDIFLDGFVQKAMCMAMLHRFDLLRPVFERFPQLAQVATLEDLAGWLWRFSD